jgi:tRNA pseudouridine38-40 synthase
MRFALGIEYDGSGFNGWQSQRSDPSVQDSIEQALQTVANHSVSVVAAGRTDTGVHAVCQVAHFDSASERSERQWVLGINSNLPPTVCVRWARAVPDDFHARFSAFERSYRYVILNRWVRPALAAGKVGWCRYPLNEQPMHQAAAALLGEHDFSAFRSAGCTSRHAVREITRIGVASEGNAVTLEISANGFLYHMVRNIVGSLITIGRGERPVDWMAELLEGRDRTEAAAMAPAGGLYFVGARYPDRFGLPAAARDFPAGSAGE